MFSNFSSWLDSASSVIDSASTALNEIADQGTQLINESGLLDGITQNTTSSTPPPPPTTTTETVDAAPHDTEKEEEKEKEKEKVEKEDAKAVEEKREEEKEEEAKAEEKIEEKPDKKEDAVKEVSPPTPPVTLTLTKDSLLAQPDKWENSEAEWELPLHAALEHTSSFLMPPNEVVEDDKMWQTLVKHIGLDEKEAAHFRTMGRRDQCHYVPDEDMLAWVPTEEPLYAVFSFVVPAKLSLEEFFDVLGWKNALYHKCTNSEQLLFVMKRLAGLDENAVPHPTTTATGTEAKEDTSPSGKSNGDEEADAREEEEEEEEEDDDMLVEKGSTEYWYDVEQKLDIFLQERKWFTGKESEIKEETRLAQDNLKLLESLVTRHDVRSALSESVSESCSYHRKKLNKLEEDLRPDRQRVVGTSLDLADGSAVLTLRAVCEQLGTALSAFEKVRGQSVSPEKVEASPPASITAIQEASPTRFSDEDTSFEAKLPWDE